MLSHERKPRKNALEKAPRNTQNTPDEMQPKKKTKNQENYGAPSEQ